MSVRGGSAAVDMFKISKMSDKRGGGNIFKKFLNLISEVQIKFLPIMNYSQFSLQSLPSVEKTSMIGYTLAEIKKFKY